MNQQQQQPCQIYKLYKRCVYVFNSILFASRTCLIQSKVPHKCRQEKNQSFFFFSTWLALVRYFSISRVTSLTFNVPKVILKWTIYLLWEWFINILRGFNYYDFMYFSYSPKMSGVITGDCVAACLLKSRTHFLISLQSQDCCSRSNLNISLNFLLT